VTSESDGRTKKKRWAEAMHYRGVRAVVEAARLRKERRELISQRQLYLKESRTLRAHVEHWNDLNGRLYHYIRMRIGRRDFMVITDDHGNAWVDE
jgi:hypothetical protein